MNIQELRDEVKRRQIAVQRKVARLRRSGVFVAGTSFDVRREPSKVSRYNMRQLDKYLGELNTFVDRKTSFVAGVEGAPISGADWREYKRAEKAFNEKAANRYNLIKDIHIDAANTTIDKFNTKMRRKRAPGSGGVPRPLEIFDALESFQVVSGDRLRKLTKNLERKLRDDYVPENLKKTRFQLLEAVSAHGDKRLTQLAKDLTGNQLDILWNYTDAPRDLFASYDFKLLLAAGKADEAQANIHQDDAYEVEKWLTWATNIGPQETNRSKRSKKG